MDMKKCDMCGKGYKPDMGVKLSVSGVIPKGASVPDVQWERADIGCMDSHWKQILEK